MQSSVFSCSMIAPAKWLLFSAVLLQSGFAHAATSLKITGFQDQQLVGTTSNVPGSGTADNYSGTAAVDDFVVFDVTDASDNDYADLKVTYHADNGSVGSDIMIAQTTNSQGLVDDGTLSILITIGDGSGGSVSLRFQWYAPGSFVNGVQQGTPALLTAPINYTTFDIDFQQFVGIPDSSIQEYTLDGSTVLTPTVGTGQILFEDSGANSTFNDPTTAASFLSTGGVPQDHVFSMGKQVASGNALFMFEFRDPSQNVTFNDPQVTPVPEPGVLALLGLSLLLGLRRKRTCQ